MSPVNPSGARHGQQAPELYMATAGAVPASEMLNIASSAASTKKWVLRAGGWLLLWGGSWLSLSFLPALVGYVPLLGGFASSLVGSALGLVTFGGSLGVALLVVAAAWARFRPLHSSLLAAVATALLYLQRSLMRERRAGMRLGDPDRMAGGVPYRLRAARPV